MNIDPKLQYIKRQKQLSSKILSETEDNIERIATACVATTHIHFDDNAPNFSNCSIKTKENGQVYDTFIHNDGRKSCTCAFFVQKNKYLQGLHKKNCKHLYLHSLYISLVY